MKLVYGRVTVNGFNSHAPAGARFLAHDAIALEYGFNSHAPAGARWRS